MIDLAEDARAVKRRYLDDITGEFPRLDERFAGLSYGHGYYAASTNREAGLGFNALAHHDFEKGQSHLYELPLKDGTGEPVFVPRSRAAPQGEGYLLSVVYRGSEKRSDLGIFDAQRLSRL